MSLTPMPANNFALFDARMFFGRVLKRTSVGYDKSFGLKPRLRVIWLGYYNSIMCQARGLFALKLQQSLTISEGLPSFRCGWMKFVEPLSIS